ncbi:MAG: flagellar hook capping protein [Planctomycetaceae bacterium]|nr:flagellar hook capping protein [Planctomycetaceae bacterium]
MSSVDSTNSYLNLLNSSYSTTANSDRMNDLTMSDFIKMMTAELQNQDPTNPMSNTDMLSQIGQIRSITSNDKLSSSIEALTLGQALSTASNLIGKNVTGTDRNDNPVAGTVDKITIEDGVTTLHIGSSEITVNSIKSIDR